MYAKPKSLQVRLTYSSGPQAAYPGDHGKVFAVVGPFHGFEDKPGLQSALRMLLRGWNIESATEKQERLPIANGDQAEFEQEHAGTWAGERPDWPLPSFDATDWAAAFCARFQIARVDDGKPSVLSLSDAVDLMLTWFSGALMRGFDEHASRMIHEAANEDPTLPKLLRALASGEHAQKNKHDVILHAAADEIDKLRRQIREQRDG